MYINSIDYQSFISRKLISLKNCFVLLTIQKYINHLFKQLNYQTTLFLTVSNSHLFKHNFDVNPFYLTD